ncbi:proline-, glutamic acid- and leucine-rich protein 1-like [Neocloeon triangulifer]|uniref:proline-, glutamic acid- and leucine-rich protein 1-like n=1 Tax=Neocloeon triangulifer TaxID=2078957 RepID=UPI00286EEAAB|nr:proline-, glutamic acid- and leucine-rich protein 1-like [Neocloeon triangulifer]XP_059486255.1 proline-, glutamic acid- and leucine-rich protein 1-like [Neocloeon triangulifer]
MEREVESSLSVLNNPWGDGASIKCLIDTWKRSQLLSRADHNTVQPILTAINKAVASQNDKLNGLRLMVQIAKDASDSCLAENGAAFIQQASRCCDKHNNLNVRSYGLLIIQILSKRADKFPNMIKAITGSAVPQVVDCLNEPSPNLKLHACHALSSIFNSFSSSCGSIKANVEKRLLEIVDNLNTGGKGLPMVAANCFASLPLIGGGGVAQQGHQAAFVQLQKKTIGSMHLELDALYEGVQELPTSFQFNAIGDLGLLPVKAVQPSVRLHKIEKRIKYLSYYLNALLIRPMTIQKSVLVQDILGLVCRALGVTSTSLGTGELLEMQVLRDLIPAVHSSFLSILTALISVSGTNLLIYQETFYQLLKNSLAWTQNKQQNVPSTGCLRKYAYDCLDSWLNEMKGASGFESYADAIMPHLLNDITPEKVAVVLKVVNKATKRKKGRAPAKPSIFQPAIDVPKVVEKSLCKAALEVVNSILVVAGNLIKSSHHKTLQTLVVGLLIDIQRGQDLHNLYKPMDCQLLLYEILQSMILFSHPLCPPPTIYATMLFSAGQSNQNKKIKRVCQQGLQVTHRVSFPVYPSIVMESEVLEDLKDHVMAQREVDEDDEESVASGEPEQEDAEVPDGIGGESETGNIKEVELESSAEGPDTKNFQDKETCREKEEDSDLEVLEEIQVTTVEDAASDDNDLEEEQEEIVEEAKEKKPVVQSSVDLEEIELLDEQPAIKKKKVNEPDCFKNDVATMLADFIE